MKTSFQAAVEHITKVKEAKELMCWYCFYKAKLPLLGLTEATKTLTKELCSANSFYQTDLRELAPWKFALSNIEAYEPELLRKAAFRQIRLAKAI